MVQVGIESENGWRPPDLRPGDARLKWFTVPGSDDVNLQLQIGRPATIMLAVAAAFNQFIEPLRDADSAAYTDGNSVFTSNHKNATAMDLNWNNHPFETRGTFTASQQKTIRDLVDFFEGWIYWSGDWDDPVDEMHWQMGYDTWTRTDAQFNDFATRKIRADGTSTFGGADPDDSTGHPDTQLPDADAAGVLYDAVPVIDESRAAELLGPVRAGLIAAQCNNPKRIAMYLAQCGHESDGFATTEEYGKGAGKPYYPYYGRAWIQVTWQSNYAAFGQWAVGQGLITDPAYFVNNPDALSDLKWAGIASAWYWVVARPTINSLCDNGDIVGVTQLINGGQNGIDDRRTRYNQAIALGDKLLTLITPTPDDPGAQPVTLESIAAQLTALQADVTWIREQLDVSRPDWDSDADLGTDSQGRPNNLRTRIAKTGREVDALTAAKPAKAPAKAAAKKAPAKAVR